MNTNKLMIAACLSVGIGIGANAQTVFNATQSDLGIYGVVSNTGLAIAPGVDVQAAVFDDGSGVYNIYWIESASSSIVDVDANSGENPDVAYYSNADALIVGYENGGDLFVDEYYLSSLSPIDYNLGGTNHISGGTDINVDINSQGRGVLTWENGGDIFACSYQVGGSVGPIVYIDGGIQPDIVLFDDGSQAAITYIQGGQGGDLFIETMDYVDLHNGGHSPTNQWTYGPAQIYEFPRIASNRNANFGGDPDDFTVVVQDYNVSPGSATVDAFFVTNSGATMNPQVLVNSDFANCGGDYPLPVVTYHLGDVRIAWSQYYPGTCSVVSQTNPNNQDDILTKDFTSGGFPTTGDYNEVNMHQSIYGSISRTSIASEYDGNYLVTASNYHSAVLYNDLGDLIWKGIDVGNPSYLDENEIISEQVNNFSLTTSPVDQTIEVISESDDFATFQLIDNAGRTVELKTVSNEGNNYSIDISHLSGGTYLLNCSSASGNEVIRIMQVTK